MVVEFYALCCVVKEIQSKVVVLEGILENGLYLLLEVFEALNSSPENKATLMVKIGATTFVKTKSPNATRYLTPLLSYAFVFCTKNVWHQRLGHPSSRILSQVLHLCKASIKDNEKE